MCASDLINIFEILDKTEFYNRLFHLNWDEDKCLFKKWSAHSNCLDELSPNHLFLITPQQYAHYFIEENYQEINLNTNFFRELASSRPQDPLTQYINKFLPASIISPSANYDLYYWIQILSATAENAEHENGEIADNSTTPSPLLAKPRSSSF
ncbi:MAG: hypothetical protein KIT27_07475 [Legionellales bacterium]|nr:hypothetical protein [Legionellales bacterium]